MTPRPSLAAPARSIALVLVALSCGDRTNLLPTDAPRDASPADALDEQTPEGGPSDGPATCEGGAARYAYALDAFGALFRYDPVRAHKKRLGVPACGNSNNPWTMTVATDKAYIVYTDWTLYAVDLTTLDCSPTPFQAGQLGLDSEFGVAARGSGASGQIFFYGVPSGGSSPILAVADTTSFVLTRVGDVLPAPPPATFPVNFTADPEGRLYAFSPGGFLQQIDATTGAVTLSVDTGVRTQFTWATIADGHDVYLWVGSIVVKYDLAARARAGEVFVGVDAVGAGALPACPGG